MEAELQRPLEMMTGREDAFLKWAAEEGEGRVGARRRGERRFHPERGTVPTQQSREIKFTSGFVISCN